MKNPPKKDTAVIPMLTEELSVSDSDQLRSRDARPTMSVTINDPTRNITIAADDIGQSTEKRRNKNQRRDSRRMDPRGKTKKAPVCDVECGDEESFNGGMLESKKTASSPSSPLPDWTPDRAHKESKEFQDALGKLELVDQTKVYSDFVGQVRSMCTDPVTGNLNRDQIGAWEGPLKKLFITAIPTLTINTVRKALTRTQGSLADSGRPVALNVFTQGGRLYLQQGESDPKLIANFSPESIRSGICRYLYGPKSEVYSVTLMDSNKTLELKGALYTVKSWHEADSSLYFVSTPNVLRQYLDYRIQVDGILSRDENLDRVYWVGTYRDEKGQIRWTHETKFPWGNEECPYNELSMPDSQGDESIRLISKLYKDKAAAMWLTWVLGTAFKPAFGNTYPHLAVIARKESGKTTAANMIRERFGLTLSSAAIQYKTDYRTKKTLSNTNLPVILDEIQRIQRSAEPIVVEALNSAYNISASNHGPAGKWFTVGAPAMMLGQDWPFRDTALSAKTVFLDLDGGQKDKQALEDLRNCQEKAPLQRWMQFACQYANEHVLMAEAQSKVLWLKEQLAESLGDRTDESERTLFNYATLLVTADAIKEFGLDLDIADFVLDRVRKHMTEEGAETGEAQQPIGKQFIWDLVNELQITAGRSAIPFVYDADGLHFNLNAARKRLDGNGKRYDIKSNRGLGKELKEAGARYDAENRRTLNKVQMRCVSVPESILTGMNVDLSGLTNHAAGGNP